MPKKKETKLNNGGREKRKRKKRKKKEKINLSNANVCSVHQIRIIDFNVSWNRIHGIATHRIVMLVAINCNYYYYYYFHSISIGCFFSLKFLLAPVTQRCKFCSACHLRTNYYRRVCVCVCARVLEPYCSWGCVSSSLPCEIFIFSSFSNTYLRLLIVSNGFFVVVILCSEFPEWNGLHPHRSILFFSLYSAHRILNFNRLNLSTITK